MDHDIVKIFRQFFDDTPVDTRLLNTSRGDADFRTACIIETESGSRYVLKLADNDFTLPERITVWQRTVEEYRKLGYYCRKLSRC